jgi:hypothetical protein
MADMSDVERALVATLGAALFPSISYQSGDYQPSAASGSIVTKLYRGWPESANLNADLALGRAHVSIFPEPITRVVSRWFPAGTQQVVTAYVPTITATVSGSVVTLGGTVTAGNVVGIQCGSPLKAYAYIAKSSDTLATCATALAAKVSGATSAGAAITLPTGLYIAARVMVPQTVYTVMRQQQQGLRVSVWAPTPSARDALASLCDNALASLKAATGQFTRFMPVNSYEAAKVDYRSTFTNDMPARDRVWRRDLCYTIEYPTCFIENDPAVLFEGGTLTLGPLTGATQQMGAIAPTS